MTEGSPPAPLARFPDVSDEVGDVEVYDNGADFIVAVPRFTHTHFQTAGEVADFLDDVFAGRVAFYGSPKAGGYRRKGPRRRMPVAGWMALAWLLGWVVAIALYLAGMKAPAFYALSALVVVSIPWVLLTVVVSFLEMRRVAKSKPRE